VGLPISTENEDSYQWGLILKQIFTFLIIIITILLSSKSWRNEERLRSPSSSSSQIGHVLQISKSFDTDRKLFSLLCYHIIVEKNLSDFNKLIPNKKLHELYLSRPYLSISTAKEQIAKIEEELKWLYGLNPVKVESNITNFANSSSLAAHSVKKLIQELKFNSKKLSLSINSRLEFKEEFKTFENTKEFKIYQQNIEHLSFLMEVKLKNKIKNQPKRVHLTEISFKGLSAEIKLWNI
jgi:hypothetical protein